MGVFSSETHYKIIKRFDIYPSRVTLLEPGGVIPSLLSRISHIVPTHRVKAAHATKSQDCCA